MKKLLLIISIGLFGLNTNATHIIGGEMSYQYVGNDIYHMTLRVYRDCINGAAYFDNPAYIFVFNSNGVLLVTLNASLLQVDTIPLSLSCQGIPPDICAEQGTYEFDLTLPAITGGYTIVYQRCCRSSIIGNLVDPLNEGMTISTIIPDPSIVIDNSSPVFANDPPTAFCVGIPIYYDHSATDADGDSLVYSLCTGVAGGESMNPQPIPPLPPPYPEVTYAFPYTWDYPFNSNPALAIDANTGLITGTPTSIGIFTLGICVREYRNGILIEEHRREMAEVYTVAGMPTGIDDAGFDSKAIVYPVPATNEISVILPLVDKIIEVKIFDMSGRILMSQKIDQSVHPFKISLTNYKQGEYLLQLVREFSIQTESFVVTK